MSSIYFLFLSECRSRSILPTESKVMGGATFFSKKFLYEFLPNQGCAKISLTPCIEPNLCL